MKILRIEFSKHKGDRQKLRKFTDEEVYEAIANGKRTVKGRGELGGFIVTFELATSSGIILCVVTEVHKGICYVITAYYLS